MEILVKTIRRQNNLNCINRWKCAYIIADGIVEFETHLHEIKNVHEEIESTTKSLEELIRKGQGSLQRF